jgi:hypothetical protein
MIPLFGEVVQRARPAAFADVEDPAIARVDKQVNVKPQGFIE